MIPSSASCSTNSVSGQDDFYVEEVECMFCGSPPEAAPNLMSMRTNAAGYPSCYFKRQPQNEAEIDEAIAGIHASCCGAVQYRGSDTSVLIKLGSQLGHSNPGLLRRSKRFKRPLRRLV